MFNSMPVEMPETSTEEADYAKIPEYAPCNGPLAGPIVMAEQVFFDRWWRPVRVAINPNLPAVGNNLLLFSTSANRTIQRYSRNGIVERVLTIYKARVSPPNFVVTPEQQRQLAAGIRAVESIHSGLPPSVNFFVIGPEEDRDIGNDTVYQSFRVIIIRNGSEYDGAA